MASFFDRLFETLRGGTKQYETPRTYLNQSPLSSQVQPTSGSGLQSAASIVQGGTPNIQGGTSIPEASTSSAHTVAQSPSQPSKVKLTKGVPKEYVNTIVESAKKYGVDPLILSSVLRQESNFRPDIITGKTKSKTGAQGIGQFMSIAREELENLGFGKFDPNDPKQAIPAAAFYLSQLTNKLQDNGPAEEAPLRAAAAYNAGPTAVRKAFANAGGNSTLDNLIAGKLLPQETAAYIPKVRQHAADVAEY